MDAQELSRKLAQATLDKRALMSRIVITVESEARRGAPVDTGRLRRSITSQVETTGERGVIGTNVEYARYVHDGTRHQDAQPFLTDALEASRDTIDELLEAAGEELFARIA